MAEGGVKQRWHLLLTCLPARVERRCTRRGRAAATPVSATAPGHSAERRGHERPPCHCHRRFSGYSVLVVLSLVSCVAPFALAGGRRGAPEAPCAAPQCGNGAPALRVAQSTDFPIKYG